MRNAKKVLVAAVAASVSLLAGACGCEERCEGAIKVTCETPENSETREREVDCRTEASHQSFASALGDRFSCREVNGRPTCVLDGEPKSECAGKGDGRNACAGKYQYQCADGFATAVMDCTITDDTNPRWMALRDQFLCGVGLKGGAWCSLEGKPLPECAGVPDRKYSCRGPELRLSCLEGLAFQVEACNYPKYSCVNGSECNF